MNKSLRQVFPARDQNLCPFCRSNKTKQTDFRDQLSYREWQISGLCQECQDKVFIDMEDEDEA